MLKGYRKRFVFLNTLLVGIVLLFTFSAVGIQLYYHQYTELKSVMSQVLKPWNSPETLRAVFSPEDNTAGEAPPPEKPEDADPPPEKPDEEHKEENHRGEGKKPDEEHKGKREHYQDENITIVLCQKKTGEISVLSETVSVDGDMESIVKAIELSPPDFDTLSGYHLIYYRERTENGVKIAMADTSYIRFRMTGIIIVLAASFLLTMALMTLLSIRLSKVAARPMEEAIRMERQFVSDISHDLKTPITVILANHSIIQSSPDSAVAEQKQWLDSTAQAAHEMMEMVGEMLTLSSLESIERSVEKTSVDLSAVTGKCLLQMESLAYEDGVTLEDQIADHVMVLSDEEYTRRIVSGLVENALKYEPSGGRISVSVTVQKRKACFRVTNEGSRIAEEDLPHVFDRFYRGDKTRTERKGHGLGLTIIKRMTELLNAEIKAESSETEGTTFTVLFPLA